LRNSLDESNNKDVPHYTSIRLGINLGNAEEKTEPLYWLNPLDAPYSDLAELKQRPKFDLTDSDGDGVIDMIDQEVNSPAGAPVDTRGVTRDSDGDGIPDHLDQEPYSPPGFEIGPDGIAMVPQYMTEDDVERIIDRRPKPKIEWFLPMIHFDLDKYYIKPEFYGQLHHVASVMKTHPNLKIVAYGYADNRNPDDYNNVLSFNRAQATVDYLVSKYNIPRDRLMVMYGGEGTPLAENLPDNHRTTIDEEVKHYMNRRVEFRVAGENDSNMSRPDGPEAGKNTPGSSRPGSKYSGNKNSGY
ncbi:MAG: OmpA family protein, partial [Saprospiraceae bacterium]|nr:OmpA family protein [Saprospiraceae bacterium]